MDLEANTLTILIDSQKVVEVEARPMTSEGDDYLFLDIENVVLLLDAWQELDPARRRYGWSGNHDYEDLIITWYTKDAGLVLEWVGAFWDGRADWDGHSLEAIASSLAADCLKWGDDL